MKFKKKTRGLVGLLGVGALALGLGGDVDGGYISIKNNTLIPGVTKSELYFQNVGNADSGLDGIDSPFSNSSILQIYSIIPGINSSGSPVDSASTDAHPINTLGWDFYLGVNGSVSGIDNYLRYKVVDTTDLAGKPVNLYDVLDPLVKHVLEQDGVYHNIPLSNLTASNEEYAHWRLSVPIGGDANIDCMVDATDLNTVLSFYNQSGDWFNGDFNNDNLVNATDLNTVLSNYNQVNSADIQWNGLDPEAVDILGSYGVVNPSVPEPGTAAIWAGIGISLAGAYCAREITARILKRR